MTQRRIAAVLDEIKKFKAFTGGLSFCVYGDAEPVPGENATRVWPKQVLIRGPAERPDAWLIIEGLVFSGVTVVGLVKTGRKLRWDRISYDPSPEPPGNWGKSVRACEMGVEGIARWKKVRRRSSWQRLR